MASQQQTDRQETELKEFALRNGLNFNEKTDMYIDIISEFNDIAAARGWMGEFGAYEF